LHVRPAELLQSLLIALLPLLVFAIFTGSIYKVVTAPVEAVAGMELMQMGDAGSGVAAEESSSGLSLPPGAEKADSGGLSLPPGSEEDKPAAAPAAPVMSADETKAAEAAAAKALEPRDLQNALGLLLPISGINFICIGFDCVWPSHAN
jgi:hypothetical protein